MNEFQRSMKLIAKMNRIYAEVMKLDSKIDLIDDAYHVNDVPESKENSP